MQVERNSFCEKDVAKSLKRVGCYCDYTYICPIAEQRIRAVGHIAVRNAQENGQQKNGPNRYHHT